MPTLLRGINAAAVIPVLLALACSGNEATITGTSDRVANAGVIVTAVPVAKVVVSPANLTVKVGQQVQLMATAKAADGTKLTGRTITWSSNSSHATVSQTGVVTGKSAGVSKITAVAEGVSGSAKAQVIEELLYEYYTRGSTDKRTATLIYFGSSTQSKLKIDGKTLPRIQVTTDVNGNVSCFYSARWEDGISGDIAQCAGSNVHPYTIRLCTNGASAETKVFRYVLFPKPAVKRVAATPAELLGALATETQYLGIGIYKDCGLTFSQAWVYNYPDVDYFLWPDVFTTYFSTHVEGLLDEAAAMYRTPDAGSDYRKYVVVRSAVGLEIWH
jgi:hypothetical protein